MINNSKKTKVHFIGIGGIGMSALAHILLELGYEVSGSDLNHSENVKKLESLGAKVFIGHNAENISSPNVIVYSSAINDKNPEIAEAKRLNIPLMRRAGLLADIMKLKHGVAVAGTHGKTTTSSILATILEESGLDISYIIGGIVKNLSGHAKVGKGDFLVAEADESDGSFLMLNPLYSIITNIDNDHLDFYETEEKLELAFAEFANNTPFFGTCSLCGNDERLRELHIRMRRPSVLYGIQEAGFSFDYEARDIIHEKSSTTFDLYIEGKKASTIKTPTLGDHNVKNTLAAISIAHLLGVEISKIKDSILKFKGVGRRFQILHSQNEFEIIDDYAHHPTEISEVISTAKKSRPENRLIVVFEPHRFTRTRDCWAEYLHCFNKADELFLLPIYAASETPIKGIESRILVDDINKLHPNLASDLKGYSCMSDVIGSNKGKNHTLLFLGAGAISSEIKKLVEQL